jgi:hypothetical protein
MSLVAISGNASGTGTLTIAAPNTNSNRTLTLPDGTGTFNISGVVNEVPAGTVSAPSIYPTGDTNTGIFFPAADTIGFAEGGAEVARFNADAQFVAAAGTASLPVITTTGDVNTGIFFPAADTIAFSEGGAEAMRINSSGELLINTTSNSLSTKLFVNGSIGAQLTYGPMYYSNENNTDNVGRGSFNFQRGGSTVGQIVTTNSTCAYNSVSDYRLKENIAPMIGALGKVAQLKPCTFTWKSNSFIGQGFIAHELQEVVPDCVAGEKDAVDAEGKPVYQGVDTSFLVATLTAAIQEQQALITQLQADVAELKGLTP